jgi:hypothetical protein
VKKPGAPTITLPYWDWTEPVSGNNGFPAPYDDIGTPLGVQQRLMRHPDIKTTMNTYGSAFEKTKRRANSRVADLVLPPAIKRQLKDRAKEVSLKNLRPETATIQ